MAEAPARDKERRRKQQAEATARDERNEAEAQAWDELERKAPTGRAMEHSCRASPQNWLNQPSNQINRARCVRFFYCI